MISGLEQPVGLLIDEVQKLCTTGHQRGDLLLGFGLGDHGRGLHDLAEGRDDLRINRVCLSVPADPLGEVADLSRIDDRDRNLTFSQHSDQRRLVAARGLHHDQHSGLVLEHLHQLTDYGVGGVVDRETRLRVGEKTSN
ncbi:MAG: hypothetical protein U1A77_01585 [Pirellulales bacterium]